jgi:hypothetical protein
MDQKEIITDPDPAQNRVFTILLILLCFNWNRIYTVCETVHRFILMLNECLKTSTLNFKRLLRTYCTIRRLLTIEESKFNVMGTQVRRNGSPSRLWSFVRYLVTCFSVRLNEDDMSLFFLNSVL